MKRIGPHSRPGKLAVIDGRRAEARRMREIRQELTQHVGGEPSATQKIMIERVASLMLRMELMDRRALREGDMTEADQRTYLAWSSTVARHLKILGMKSAAQRGPSLADYLAQKAAAAATTGAAE